MGRLTNIKSSVINRDVAKQTYRGNRPYQEQMRRSTEKAIQDVTVKPESEMVRPYTTNASGKNDGYEQMEYMQLPDVGFPPLPEYTTPDIDWATLPVGSAELEFTIPVPIFVPIAGAYASAQTVYIITTPADADIYYTTDGTEPNENKTKYTTAGIVLSSDTTLKAKAFKQGWTPSDTATGIYTITITGWTAYFDNTRWEPVNDVDGDHATWTGSDWASVDISGHQVYLQELGTWVNSFRLTKLKITHDATNLGIILTDSDGNFIAGDADYTSGDELLITFEGFDIAELFTGTVDASYNITNIEFK